MLRYCRGDPVASFRHRRGVTAGHRGEGRFNLIWNMRLVEPFAVAVPIAAVLRITG
jgi:hypothetical protein